LGRHVADIRKAAVFRVVPVIAHHEEMIGWHDVNAGIIGKRTRRRALQCFIGRSVGESLPPPRDADRGRIRRRGAARTAADEIRNALAFDRGPIDKNGAANELDAVAGETDQALDEIIRAMTKNDDVAALRLEGRNAAREQGRREWKRVSAVAVAEFRGEKVVADKQRRLHRARWNAERLKQKSADEERNDDGLEDRGRRLVRTAVARSFAD